MKKTLLLMALLSLVACATQRFDIQPPATTAVSNLDDSQVFWVGGIGQQKEVDAASVCGSAKQVARVETQDSPSNILLRYVTLNIYSPRQVRIYCTQ